MDVINSLGKLTVASAGTPIPLTATKTLCHSVLIEVLSTNVGKIYIGTSALNSSTLVGTVAILGIPTSAILPVFTMGLSYAPNPINIANLYIDADNSGDGVIVSYLIS